VLADALPYVRCPRCEAGLSLAGRAGGAHEGRALRCPAGHAYDIARQGYASLLTGAARGAGGDTAAMVAARADFLGRGHFGPLADLVAGRAAALAPAEGCVLDAGAGTGYYLASVLDRLPGRRGVALDVSRHALRRAARAHPRAGALGWDVWRSLPVRTGAVGVLLNVFAPRNGAEFHRVLRPDGVLIVVTPDEHHLRELVAPLGLLTVDERKADRLAETLEGRFRPVGRWPLEVPLRLTRAEVAALVGMGPSAWHEDPRARVSSLAEPVGVTAAFEVRAFDVCPEC
jgi:23S rRNA (guanine745-N1)-methyltransferase